MVKPVKDLLYTLNIHFNQYLLTEWRSNQYITYYAFTISPHQKSLPKIGIEKSVTDMLNVCKNIISCKYIYETSKLNKIHIHGILAAKQKSKFTKLNKHPLVQYHITEYEHRHNAYIRYMSKCQPKHIYARHYGEDGKLLIPRWDLNWYLE